LADFRRPYVNRILRPLFSALGSSRATALLYECFDEIRLSPFTLNASGYHELALALYGRLKQEQLIDDDSIERLSDNWGLDSVSESELSHAEPAAEEEAIILPSDAESLCRIVSDAVLRGSLAKFRTGDDPSETQRIVSDVMGLVLSSISKLKEEGANPYSTQAGALLATQLERYERITAFSRHINTIDVERLREKIALLPDVLAVRDVAMFVADESGAYEPFYVSMAQAADDLGLGLLLASLAEEVATRRSIISGFEQEFADSYHDSIVAAGFSPHWVAFPLLIEDRFLGALMVFDESNVIYTEDESNVILRVCNHIASALQSCIQHENVKNLQQLLDDELRGVGSVQKRLLPETLPKLPGCEVSAYYRPSGRASGDYYDIVKTSDDTLSFIVADVSGHGAPAAVVMAMSKTAFRLLLLRETSADQMFPEFNDFLCDNLSPDMFVTALGGTIDVSAGILKYASAGHTPAVLSRGETGECEMLSKHSMLLGVLPDQKFPSTKVKIEKGDRLIVYTDGFTESKNETGEQFGVRRLTEAIKKASDSPAGDVMHSIILAVTDHMGGQLPDDDMTLLVFSF